MSIDLNDNFVPALALAETPASAYPEDSDTDPAGNRATGVRSRLGAGG